MKASIEIIKPRMIELKLIDSSKANRLFPYFEEMLKMSDEMINIIGCYKRENIAEVRIGERLNKIVSYYKIYLEYFKHKSEIKNLYEDLEKVFPKELRAIEAEVRAYFDKLYQ